MDDPEDGGGGPTPGQVLAGILLVLFGLCIFLAGGACTLLWIAELVLASSNGSGGFSPILFLLSAGLAALGLYATVSGVRMLRGRKRGGGAAPQDEAGGDAP